MLERALTVALTLTSLAAAAQAAGDPQRGAAIVAGRSAGLCVLCHAVPGVPATQVGNLGPDLAGLGMRLNAADQRQRLLAPERSNPETVMPAYGRSEGLVQVSSARQGQPLLDEQQIEDVLAYLGTLQFSWTGDQGFSHSETRPFTVT